MLSIPPTLLILSQNKGNVTTLKLDPAIVGSAQCFPRMTHNFSFCRLHSTVNNMQFFWCMTHKDLKRARFTNRRLCVFLLSFPVIIRLLKLCFTSFGVAHEFNINCVSPNFRSVRHLSRPPPSNLHVDLYLEILSLGKNVTLIGVQVATVFPETCFFFTSFFNSTSPEFRKMQLKITPLFSYGENGGTSLDM